MRKRRFGRLAALVMALACPRWDIRAITTVGGNNTIENVTSNALRVLEVTGRTEIPVASGQAAPFLRELVQTGKFHGRTGMDGHHLPPPATKPVSSDAVGLMAKILEESETPVTLLVTGVFTNIATLLFRDGRRETPPMMSKEDLADVILDRLLAMNN